MGRLVFKWESIFAGKSSSRACKHYICRKKVSRKSKNPFYTKIRIESIGAEGKAIARIDDMVVFTRLVIPGDVVDLQVIKKRKSYQEAVVTKIHEYSEDRTEAFCRHFGVCGGCKWQYLPYQKQLHYKQKQVEDQLRRIGRINSPAVSPILGSENSTFYRNKLEFTFSNKRWLTNEEIRSEEPITDANALGFHIPGLFDKVINIEECWLQRSPSNEIRNYIYEYALENQLEFFDIKEKKGFLRTLIIRTGARNELMVIVSFYKENTSAREGLLKALLNRFPEITSLLYVINPKGNDTITDQNVEVFAGREFIYEEMEDLKFKVGPKSFYQTNSDQAYNLYNVVRNFSGLTGTETVYDLYTGTGTIANFVARNAKKVIGIEYVPEAISDAKENSLLNHINNTYFYSGDIKDVLSRDFAESNGNPDVIITDPPRAGMHADVVKKIMDLAPRKIVYVSCNPATQARDLLLLSHLYNTVAIQPVDMFPHTHHVENVVLLEKKVESSDI
jgi:23S rRNA (uracil1939-C5)-methyltransferase